MVALPNEIWLHISKYLPLNDLISLADLPGINSALQVEAKKAKYESMNFTTIEMVKSVIVEMSDKGDRCLVRSVAISPWQIPLPITPARSQKVSFWQRWFRQTLDSDYSADQEDVDCVTRAFKQFDNITEYRIVWNEGSRYHAGLFHACLFSTLKILGGRLVILALKVPMEMLSNDIAGVCLPKLQRLDVHFATGEFSTADINQRLEALLVFVNNLNGTLLSISIRSTSYSRYLELGSFFRYLGYFPRLQEIVLCVPFNGGHILPIDHFREFINQHRRSLQSLEIGTNSCSVGAPSWPSWIQDTITHIYHAPLPHIRELTIALRPVRADLTILYDFLIINSSTLENIKLTDRQLVFEEVETILNCLGTSPLKRLFLMVQYLTPQLLSLLATRTPHIMSLGLIFGDISVDEVCPAGDKTQWNKTLSLFCESLCRPELQLRRGGLQHIALQWSSKRIPSETLLRCLETKLVETIPTLRSVTEIPV